jgi:putative von willebrand factor type A domain protein
MNTFQNRMSKYITLARFRKVALGCMGALCLSAGLLFSQGASAQATTSNLDLHFELIKATNTGTVSFTIAPEDPNQVSRSHWPIIFIDWMNDGNNVTQMINLTEERTFTVNVTVAGGAVAKVYGENGTWKLVCNNQEIKNAKLEKASALRYLDLSKNVLGTNNTNKDYTIHDDNNKIETLILNENQLKDIKFGTGAGLNGVLPDLKVYKASENLLTSAPLAGNNSLIYLDLSKNLLTSVSLPTSFQYTQSYFKGGNQTEYNNALALATPGQSPMLYQTTGAGFQRIDLTVNKLDIATLPTLPANIDPPNYFYTLQERYSLPKNEYKMLEEIDLSSQLTATGVQTAPQTTTYRWFREIAPNTDNYIEMVRGSDYEETGGKTKFYRAYGDDTKIFAAMTTDAFGMTGTYPLESFERGTGTFTLHGFENVLLQPAGTTAAALKDTYFASVKASTLNGIGDGKEAKAKATQFFRTNTLTVKGSKNNFWYGFKSNDWSDEENWTGRVVPKTLVGDYTNDENSDVLFASTTGYTIGTETLVYPSSAIRDLYTDQDRVVRNLYNKSEDGRAIVADAGHKLLLKGKAYLDRTTKEPYNAIADVSYRTIVKSVENKPNGTFLIEKPTDNPNYVATVEFYSKANDGNRNKQAARWQYFGSPVQDAKVVEVVPSTSWVRKYNRELNLADTDEKWEEVPAGVNFTPGHGYEITQPRPMTYRFTGKLDLADHNFPVDGVTGGPNVNYKDMNILANPYTAAMKIADIDWTGAAGVAEQTVYLYNTGSREEWLAQNGGTTNGTNGGQYVKAVPRNLPGYVAGMEEEIPSLSAFMIKSTGAGTVKYSYQSLVSNTKQNRAPRRRLSSLMIDVESDKSADRMWLVEAQGKTKNYDDGFDGEKIFTAASAQLYAIQDRNYQVTTAADLDNTELGFVAGDGAKHYTLTFNLDEMSDDRYYLVDHLTHEQKPITNGMTYSFNAGANDPANRFAISRSTKSITDDVFEGKGIELRAKSGRTIEARNYTDETAEVEIFDVSGKVVDKFTVEPHDTDRIKLSLEGVFVVRAYNGQAKTTQKFIIK